MARYERKADGVVVMAELMGEGNEDLVIQTPRGRIQVCRGWWLVGYPNGSLDLVSDRDFQEGYRKAKERDVSRPYFRGRW